MSYWNDSEQKNYHLYKCKNPENTGGKPFEDRFTDYHDSYTYSCWYKNERMKHRCWSTSERILECPMALTYTEPEVKCERFVEEKVHPSKALVTKEEMKKRFYQADFLCITCGNCIK